MAPCQMLGPFQGEKKMFVTQHCKYHVHRLYISRIPSEETQDAGQEVLRPLGIMMCQAVILRKSAFGYLKTKL